ncbi:MAG TPA: prephenate dehydrogenase [Gemmatimonadaceae bacterium]|nr:prephenate dehydrogenase [Gemmatimonadaceae bacterium]
MTADFRTASIIGLGLIGGSLARDLAARGVRVRAYDADEGQLDDAIRAGIVSGRIDPAFEDVSADLIVVAVPVDAAGDVLRRTAPFVRSAKLITDVGSTKTAIVEAARALGLHQQFVGSHPMAGDHRSGWDASRSGLFSEARVYLCPASGAPTKALDLAYRLWTELGACPECIDAKEHDRRLAWSSHLPHVAAASIAIAMADAGISRGDLGPGGRDVTRLAGSSPEVWTAIALENAAAIDAALAGAEREIASFRQALTHGDGGELRRRFVAARNWFEV